MLSDSLFEIRQKLLKEIAHYADEPWGSDYPNSQKHNLILAIYHLTIAQMAYDFGNSDDHEFNTEDKSKAMKRATKEYEDAVSRNNSDSD